MAKIMIVGKRHWTNTDEKTGETIEGGTATTTFLQVGIVGSSTIVTSTIENPFINPSQTSSTFEGLCGTQPESAFAIGEQLRWAGCSAINFLFNPNSIVDLTGWFSQQFDTLKAAPPFGGVLTAISNVSSTFSNLSPDTNGIDIGIKGYNNEQRTLMTLNSSTFYGGFGNATGTTRTESHNTMNFLTTYITAWLWLGAGIKIVYVLATV